MRIPGNSNLKFLLFPTATFVLLFSSFALNIFRIETFQVTENIKLVDLYIVPALHYYASASKSEKYLGPIQTPDSLGAFTPYVMQFGLQRILYSSLAPGGQTGVDRAIPILRIAIAAALALALTIFVLVVSNEFGCITAAISAAMLSLSNWLIVFAPDLFWATATFFLPFVAGWLLGDPARPKATQRFLAVLFTILCVLKALCGYDYVTNVFGAIAVPLLYYGLRRGVPLARTFARIARYGALSVVAFSFAIILQIIQFSFVEGDFHRDISLFLKEARRRTVANGEGIGQGYDRIALSVLHRLSFQPSNDSKLEPYLVFLRPFFRYIRYLTMGAMTIPIPGIMIGMPIGAFVVGFLLVFAWKRELFRYHFQQPAADKITAWAWATLAALVISHLWAVAANGHMTHTFFNAIIFYIPFIPMVYVFLVELAVSAIRRVKVNSSGRSATLAF